METRLNYNRYKIYINNQWVDSDSGKTLDSYNPYTAKVWAEIQRANAYDANLAVEAAYEAFTTGEWPKLTATKRGALLRKFADLLEENVESLAKIEVQDNGKLIAEMTAQLRYLPQFFYYYAGLADKIEGQVIPTDKPNHVNFTNYEPLGVVVGITAWNSPLLLASMKLAPALAAGNTFVLKPSEHASVSSLEFVKLFKQAGFPPGVVNVVTGLGNEVGHALVTHPKVAKVAFTGSEQGGKKVYESAARDLKRVTLELGGKSPNIVFQDANMDKALNGVVSGIFAATGQTCIAGSRLLVHKSIHDEFVDKLVAIAKLAKMGDPLFFDTQIAPITTKAHQAKILEYIDIAKNEGATAVLGGSKATRPECGDGWFVEPTIFTGVHNKMRIAQEEVFGPVLSVIPFSDDEEAIAIANDVPYGLAAGVWTENISRVFEITKKLQAGTIWVNTYRAFSALSPFGGYKHSGLGRENGKNAIYEYLQTKSVWISLETEVAPNPFIMKI